VKEQEVTCPKIVTSTYMHLNCLYFGKKFRMFWDFLFWDFFVVVVLFVFLRWGFAR
jgi:hypothetical protein